MSMYPSVVISPATTTRPVVRRVSHATRLVESTARAASRTASDIWSATLSGCPSVTDSEVNWWRRGIAILLVLALVLGAGPGRQAGRRAAASSNTARATSALAARG